MVIMAATTVCSGSRQGKDDDHEHDLVMPGFRFHPTEEELIEFYLRRKVEGKRFNVELISSLDLYRYDPWELPALAAIGEKEWFFYVPRDRKYRNGDRPNRVTTSGYWKATGADRAIHGEDSLRSIGLKKTLVFYSGKAPKGIRSSWIMNEYRLPHSDTNRYQKTEISLCRVYKRAGVEDHHRLPGTLRNRPSSSRQPAQTAGTKRTTSHWESSPSSSSSIANNTKQHAFCPWTTEDRGAAACHSNNASNYLEYSPFNCSQSQQLLPLPPQVSMPAASDKLWEWNLLSEYGCRDYHGFK